MNMRKIIGALLLTLGLSLTAGADENSTWSWSRHRDDDHAPAAPEPAQLLLIAGGLTLVGVYIAWRQRRVHAKKTS